LPKPCDPIIKKTIKTARMKYDTLSIQVPDDKREAYNHQIVERILSGDVQDMTPEEMYNLYTGKARLHQLDRRDFSSYYAYAEAKKAYEQGQFFTPHALCRQVCAALQPPEDFTICDLTCGIGNFFNFLPQENNLYGNEIDPGAYTVCRYLYPEAHISKGDFIYYARGEQFDIILGNPPFNLHTAWGSSQWAYIQKSEQLLKFGGLLALIVPERFLSDAFQDGHKIDWLNEHFHFVLQAPLPSDAFDACIETKLLILQKKGVDRAYTAYDSAVQVPFVPDDIYVRYLQPLYAQYRADAPKLYLLTVQNLTADKELGYQIKKRLWHIKSNPALHKKYYRKTMQKLEEARNPVRPEGVSEKEWERVKPTPDKVLRWMITILKNQNRPRGKKVLKIVKTAYGLKQKAYHKSLEPQAWSKSVHDLLLSGERFGPYKKLYDRKKKALDLQNTPWTELSRDPAVDAWLDAFALVPKRKGFLFEDMEAPTIRLNNIQKSDLGLLLQKRYDELSWEQGGGKSVAGMAWMRYHHKRYRNCFLLAPALAITGTWVERLDTYGFSFVQPESISDLEKIKPGQIVIMSYDRLVTLQRHVKKWTKRQSYKIALLVDESDELTNGGSQRSRAALNCFRKGKLKLLTTGTTTRNTVNEAYTQMELLYNNSTAFTCWAERIYHTDKDNNLKEVDNPYYGYPFPAYKGAALFKASFCPQRSTVFGIRQDTQDIYNASLLKELIAKTIITRKFEEIVGEKKYSIHTHAVLQNEAERDLYTLLMKEFLKVCYDYYTTTGNTRKDAALRLIRQIKLLIKATSIPHLMAHYTSDERPNKYGKVRELIGSWPRELVTVGTIFKATAYNYYTYLKAQFPRRSLFYIDGEDPIPKRKKILEQFRHSGNGILVCTQQSLKSSVNIPYCNKCIIESLQWNIPRISQFYFRFIRFDSRRHSQVHFVNYENTIEINLLALLMAKEKLNDFMKTTNETTTAAIYEEFGIDLNILDSLIQKDWDSEGRLMLRWGKQVLY
jgi:hypothetical protein